MGVFKPNVQTAIIATRLKGTVRRFYMWGSTETSPGVRFDLSGFFSITVAATSNLALVDHLGPIRDTIILTVTATGIE